MLKKIIDIENKIFLRDSKALTIILVIDIIISAFMYAIIFNYYSNEVYNNDIKLKINLKISIEQLNFFLILLLFFIIFVFLYRLINKGRLNNYSILKRLGSSPMLITTTLLCETFFMIVLWIVSFLIFSAISLYFLM